MGDDNGPGVPGPAEGEHAARRCCDPAMSLGLAGVQQSTQTGPFLAHGSIALQRRRATAISDRLLPQDGHDGIAGCHSAHVRPTTGAAPGFRVPGRGFCSRRGRAGRVPEGAQGSRRQRSAPQGTLAVRLDGGRGRRGPASVQLSVVVPCRKRAYEPGLGNAPSPCGLRAPHTQADNLSGHYYHSNC